MRFVDLFSGIGGFHLAANHVFGDSAEFVGYSEIDPVCKSIYKKAFDINNIHLGGDIRTLISRQSDEWSLPQFDVCLAGFPCQPFSNVGKRQGLFDERSWVFFDLVRVLKYYKPKYFVFENVEKIKTINGGELLASFIKHLEDAGYVVDTFSLSAKDYGLPQQRKRLFLAGRIKTKGKNQKSLPIPKTKLLEDSKYPSAWHLLERAMPAKHVVPVGSRKTIFTKNEKWMGDLEIDRHIARPVCATMGKWHRANQDNYYTEYFIKSPVAEKHPNFDYRLDSVRRITPLEALRLQGFPDIFSSYIDALSISPTPAYKAIGNAVPVDMAAAVLKNLLENT